MPVNPTITFLEDIAKGASLGLDAFNGVRAVEEYYLGERCRAAGDLKNFKIHRKEARKYYGLILDDGLQKSAQKIMGSYLKNP